MPETNDEPGPGDDRDPEVWWLRLYVGAPGPVPPDDPGQLMEPLSSLPEEHRAAVAEQMAHEVDAAAAGEADAFLIGLAGSLRHLGDIWGEGILQFESKGYRYRVELSLNPGSGEVRLERVIFERLDPEDL